VHPAARRRGTGRELVRHAAARAAGHGRSFLDGVTLAGSAGDAFARAMGATLAIEEVRRVQDLRKIAPGLIASLRETAARAAAGYSLVTWTGPVPDEYLGQVAGVYNAFGDAPRGEGHEASAWDADRIRERAGGHFINFIVKLRITGLLWLALWRPPCGLMSIMLAAAGIPRRWLLLYSRITYR